MNTLIKLLSRSSTVCILALVASFGTGCALQSGPPVAEEEDSVSTAQSTGGDDEGEARGGSNRELAQPIAPDRGDLGHCNNCGPGPQPWQNPIHVTSESR